MQKHQLFLLLFAVFPLSLPAQLLFPGDTNNDGVCNYMDLLPIGLGYGQAGPARPDASLVWFPQAYANWAGNVPGSGLNLAFADADGNGVIDSLDLDAFLLNYDSLQMEAQPEPANYFPQDTLFAELFIEVVIDEDTVEAGDTLFVQLNFLPLPTFPVTAVALAVEYDTSLVVDSLVTFIPDTVQGDLLFVWASSQGPAIWRSPDPGRLEIAATGKAFPAFDQPRPIGTIQMIIVEDVTRSDSIFVPLKLEIKAPLAIRPDGAAAVPFFDIPEVTLFQVLSGGKDLSEAPDRGLYCYPNPFREQVLVQWGTPEIRFIAVFNASGRQVESYSISRSNSIALSLGHLPAGKYEIVAYSSESVYSHSLIKN
jgi:hypothetical protein